MEEASDITIEDLYDPVLFQIAYLNQTPHQKQAEVLRSKHKHKIIVCGRRSGKSQMIVGEIIRGAVLKLYPAQFLIAPTYKQAMIVFDKIIELLHSAGVYYTDIEKVTQNPPKITFKNKSFVEFASADNPNSIRGFAYDRVFKDESEFIKKGADGAIKPLTYDKGAPVWETTTPWGKGDVWEKWQRGMRGDESIGRFHYNYKDNPYLSEDGVKEIEKDILEYGEDSLFVQCEIYGNFAEDRDTYFSRELIESCIEEYNIPEEPKMRVGYTCGNDISGEGEDESVFISLMYLGEDKRVVSIDSYEKNKPREIVAKNMELYNKYKYSKICLDKTGLGEGPEDWLKEELSKKGIFGIVEGVRFTMQSKMDMYSNLKKIMNQGKLKFPNHKKLVYQLLDLRRELTSSGGIKIHHSERGHDDYPDALALACWACKDEDIYKPCIS